MSDEKVPILTDAMIEGLCEFVKLAQHPGCPNYWRDTKEGSWKELWRQRVREAIPNLARAGLVVVTVAPPAEPQAKEVQEALRNADVWAKVGEGWVPTSAARALRVLAAEVRRQAEVIRMNKVIAENNEGVLQDLAQRLRERAAEPPTKE